MGTGNKAAGQKSETPKPGTPRGTQATGEWGSKIPRGRCHQPRKVNVFFHSIAPQRETLVPGARQHLLCGHLSIAGQISTALLGLFAAPPSSRRLCLWWRPHCWNLLGNAVRSSSFWRTHILSLRSMPERAHRRCHLYGFQSQLLTRHLCGPQFIHSAVDCKMEKITANPEASSPGRKHKSRTRQLSVLFILPFLCSWKNSYVYFIRSVQQAQGLCKGAAPSFSEDVDSWPQRSV